MRKRVATEPYGAVPKSVIQDHSLGAKELRVFTAISAFQGMNDKAWPSIDAICEWTGYKTRTVNEAISVLKKSSHISAKRRFGASSVYRILWDVQSLEDAPSMPDEYAPSMHNEDAPRSAQYIRSVDKNNSQEQNVVTDLFQDLFMKATGTKPSWQAKDFKNLVPIRKAHPTQEICSVIEKYFAGDWWFAKNGQRSFSSFLQHYDEIASSAIEVARSECPKYCPKCSAAVMDQRCYSCGWEWKDANRAS